MAQRKRRSGRRKSSGAAGVLLAILLLTALIAAGAAWFDLSAYGPAMETFVQIAPGSSVAAIGRKLESAGIVRSGYAFDLLRWFIPGKLEAGMYRFDHPEPAATVYERIARGDVFTVALVVP